MIRKRISTETEVSFYHVPTHENIADCATRGVSKEELADHLWWCGSKWLNVPSEEWLAKEATDLCSQEPNDEEDTDLYSSITAIIDPVLPTERLSSFSKLSRVVAYCARFIRNASHQKYFNLRRTGVETNIPSADELV
ncbi:hypothetical protein ANCCAN_06524 [Ancylostoma caninum]|uniref:Uncharacterized protein n=1 Tax=Ancylostoma caninum TaxID=29170 RepID=A0A368GWI8_ANCCA|nr:hypothetical protein ANCCAN_06524 [Ancylostoma caninum]